MMPPHCAPERALDRNGLPRHCVMEAGHEGDHMDARGDTWEPVHVALPRLQEAWGATHRIVFLPSGMWLATAFDRAADWRTETEPTAQQLEESLQRHNPTPIPEQRSRRGPHTAESGLLGSVRACEATACPPS